MIELLNIDCLLYMATCKDKQFDLAIVDPPYGINAASGASTNGTMRQKIASGEIRGGAWDNEIPNKKYFDELFRVSGNQIIWGGNYFIDYLHNSKGFFIWDKGESIYDRDFAECEMAWVSLNKCARIFKYFPNQTDRIHPTQKPIPVYKRLLKNYAKPEYKIFDSHLGSGSSAIAAYDFGCDFVGCEIDKEYYNAAVKRFENHKLQQTIKF